MVISRKRFAAAFALAAALSACHGTRQAPPAPDPLAGALVFESPAEGLNVQGHSVPVEVAVRKDLNPSTIRLLLNGADVTRHIRFRDGKASGRVTGLALGANVLTITAAPKSAKALDKAAEVASASVSLNHDPKDIESIPALTQYEIPGLAGRVEVLTDPWGVRHIYTVDENPDDLPFAQGYVVARDRLFQMDFFRKVAQGRLTELLGTALDSSVLETSYFLRTVFTSREGTRIEDELTERLIEESPENYAFLERFTEGVNAYIADLEAGRNGAVLPQQHQLLNDLLGLLAGAGSYTIEPMTVAQILAIGRLQQYDLSRTMDEEIGRFEDWCRVVAAEEAGAIPAGTLEDLFRAAPPDPTVILPPGEIGAVPAADRLPNAAARPRPETLTLCEERMAVARKVTEAIRRTQKLLGRAEKPFSNNWTVAPELTARGFAIVANDPHLGLSNPSIFYPTHGDNKTFTGGPFNISGNTFPGIPGILVGQNERIAWGATVTNYDVTEVYFEDVTVGEGGAKTVAYKGGQVPVMTILETFKVRGGDDVLIPIDVVPHHGPQVPDPDLTDDVEGILATGMSVRWTGEEFTRDVEAFLAAAVAEDVEDFMAAFALFGVGAQNWNGADVDGNIAYFPHALIPVRTALARSHEWPPYLPQRGDGTMEWGQNPDGSLKVVPPNRVPQSKNPDQGYIVTANHDISGTLLDNDPLDDEQYLYYLAANGFRGGEIVDQLTDTPEGAWTVESVQAVQNTHRWRMATRFMPFLLEGLANNAAHAGLDAGTRAKIQQARAKLAAWDFRAETGVRDLFPGATDPSAEDVESSIGTSLFAVWLNRFSQRALNDEAAAAGVGLGGDERVKGLLHMLEDVGRTEPGFAILTAGPDGQSVLWDDLATEEVETRDRIIVLAMAQAIADMEGPLFGTADMNQWRWGKIHTETFELEGLGSVIPAFNLPGGNILTGRPEGYPRAGALDTVDPAGYGMNGISFHPGSGPAMRMVVEMEPGILTAWNVTPGGTNDVQPGTGLFNPVRIDPATHYGDQLPLWLRNQYRPQLLFWEDVTAVAESRTSLLPPVE